VHACDRAWCLSVVVAGADVVNVCVTHAYCFIFKNRTAEQTRDRQTYRHIFGRTKDGDTLGGYILSTGGVVAV
jgi:hypothetical protein